MLYYKSKLKTYSYFFIERSNMGKKKKLPPKMEQIKEREKECPYNFICEELKESIAKIKTMYENFGLQIISEKDQLGKYYDSIVHESKESHKDYVILDNIATVMEELFQEADKL